MVAEAAALTGNTADPEILYRLEAAQFLAQTALCAFLLVNKSNLPTPELLLLPDNRLKNEVQVSGIDIAVNQHSSLG
jgi:hypothetical protein